MEDARKAMSGLTRLKFEMQTNKIITDLDDQGSDRDEWNKYINDHRKEKVRSIEVQDQERVGFDANA